MASVTDNYLTRFAAVIPVGAHTSLSLANAETLTPPAGTQAVILQAITQAVSFTLDGTVPTSTVGFQLATNDMLLLDLATSVTIKAIQVTSGAVLQYQWVKYA